MSPSLCIIVPYRDRIKHLGEFIPWMRKRFKEAQIVVVEQMDNLPFNRGALLNFGFFMIGHEYDYCAFHDVDMLPTKADYSYPGFPTLLATHVQQFAYDMPSADYFGGVVLFRKEHFEKVGGYSNKFWGWGGEDNEMFFRTIEILGNTDYRDCYFNSLYHVPSNEQGFSEEKMAQAKQSRWPLDTYNFVPASAYEVWEEPGYKLIKVKLFKP
jgi:hypothetical protein